jgi:hypothetical protein
MYYVYIFTWEMEVASCILLCTSLLKIQQILSEPNDPYDIQNQVQIQYCRSFDFQILSVHDKGKKNCAQKYSMLKKDDDLENKSEQDESENTVSDGNTSYLNSSFRNFRQIVRQSKQQK